MFAIGLSPWFGDVKHIQTFWSRKKKLLKVSVLLMINPSMNLDNQTSIITLLICSSYGHRAISGIAVLLGKIKKDQLASEAIKDSLEHFPLLFLSISSCLLTLFRYIVAFP